MAIAGTLEIQLLANVARLQADMDKATRSVGGAMGGIEKSVNSAKNAFRGLVGGIGLVEIIKVTDQYTKLNAQLNIAARTQADYTKSLQDVVRISNLAQTSLEGTATLYSRLANTLKDTGVTQQQFANITESVALGLRVSGASTAEAQSAMLQLSQAFASGVLRGEEFNAVSEASFPLMKALADSMGIPIEQLRSMAQEGRITRNELVKAFGDPALIATFQNQAKELNTVGGAFQVLKNNITIAIGEFDKATGASATLAKGIVFLGQNLDLLLVALAPVGIALAGLAAPAILAGLGAIAAVFAGPVGIVALLGLAATAVYKFGINSESAYDKALKGAVKYNDEQRKQAGITKTTVSEEVKEYNRLGNAKAEATKKEEELRKRIALYSVQAANKGYVPELKRELEDVQLALKNVTKDFDAAYQKFAMQGRVRGNKVPFMQGITTDFTGAPNFNATVEAQNVDEINKKLEERANAEKQLYTDRIQAIKDADKAELERYTARFNMQKEWQGLETKFYNMFEKIKSDDEKKRFEEAKKRTELLQQQATQNFKQAQDAQKELDRENQRIARDFSRSLTDAIFRGFESGKSFAENFKDTLINSFRTLVLRPVIEFIVNSTGIAAAIQGAIGTITGQGGTASFANGVMQQRQSGIGGILSDIGNIFTSTNQSIIGGIEGIGATISNGLGGIRDTIGGFVGANANTIANLTSYAGAALQLAQGNIGGAAGTAIGTFFGGPVGGAIGSFIGGAVGGLFGGKKQPPRTVNQLPQVAEQFSGQLSALLGGFGLSNKVSASANYTGRSGGSGYGNLFTNINGARGEVRTKDAGGYSEANLEAFANRVLTTELVSAIRSTKLSGAIKNLFTGLTKQGDIATLINDVVRLNGASKELTQSLDITVDQVALMAKEGKIAGANFTALTDALLSTSTEALTIGDAILNLKGNIQSTIGTALPNSLKSYDEALKAVNTTTVSGRAEFLKLLDTRGAFSQFNSLITGLQNNVRNGLFSIVSESEKQAMQQADLAKLFGDLNREVPASIQELIALGKSIDYTTAEGLNLAAVFPALVDAFNQTKGAVDALLTSLNPNNFSTFADFAVGASLARQGVPVSRIPSSGLATPFVPNQSSTTDNGQVANLLQALLAEMKGLNQTSQATAESTRRTASELELITEGSVTLNTTGA